MSLIYFGPAFSGPAFSVNPYGRPPEKMNLHVQPFTVTQDSENNTDWSGNMISISDPWAYLVSFPG